MITPDPSTTTPLKGQQQSNYPATVPPPSYGASTASSSQGYQALQTRSHSVGKRFLRAFLVAVGIWAMFGLLVDSVVEMGRFGRSGSTSSLEVARPIHADGHVKECVGASDWKAEGVPRESWYNHAGSTSFDLPLDANLYYLFSRGSFSTGDVRIAEPESGLSDKIKVDVHVKYYYTEVFEATTVCLLERDGGEHGVGIFTPERYPSKRRDWKDHLEFQVVVHLPNLSPLKIKRLETQYSSFSHHLGELSSVDFGSLSLSTSNSVVEAAHLLVKDTTVINTTNGAIHLGRLNSTKIDISTSNGPVTVDALYGQNTWIHSTSGAIKGSFESPEIELSTTNGPIEAKTLLAQHARVKTSNGHISGSFIAPDLELFSSNGPIDVESVKTHVARIHTTNSKVHGSFESDGSLDIVSSNGPVQVAVKMTDKGSDSKDLKLFLKSTTGSINAAVTLLSESKMRSHFSVSAQSSNAPVDLTIVESPIDSVLTLDGISTNGPVVAVLPAAYEGSFNLTTSTFFTPQVKRNDAIEDPTGRGRQRAVETRQVGRGVVAGSVAWEKAGKRDESGKVVLRSTNAPITLVL